MLLWMAVAASGAAQSPSRVVRLPSLSAAGTEIGAAGGALRDAAPASFLPPSEDVAPRQLPVQGVEGSPVEGDLFRFDASPGESPAAPLRFSNLAAPLFDDPAAPQAAIVVPPAEPGAADALPDSVYVPADRPNPWGPKPGFLQRIQFQDSWIPRLGEAAGMGLNTAAATVSVGVPLLSFDSPLVLTTGFGITSVDGPTVIDVPPELYEATLDALWIKPWTKRLTSHLGITPGSYSDFQQNDSRGFRITGRGFAMFQATPERRWILGVVYLNRPGLRFVPAVGLIWQPRPEWRADLLFPLPRLSRRLVATERYERWVYLGGELGGGAWAVERADGQTDVLSINDWRWRLGLEHLPYRGWKSWCEVAYVSFRSIEYQSSLDKIKLNDSLMLRGGLAW